MSTKRHGGRLLAVLAVLVAAAVPASASATTGTLTTATGNPGCADIDPSWTEFKIDRNPSNGTYTADRSTLEVVISNRAGNSFDWSANLGIDAVLVKGGTDTNVYTYDPEATGDSGLSSPGTAQISHVAFCYDAGQPPPPPPSCEDQNAGGPDTDGNGVPDACEPPPPPSCEDQNAGGPDTDGNGVPDACEEPPPPDNPNPPPNGDTTTTTNSAPPPPAGPAPEQQSAPAVDQPGQVVLGERVAAPRARLLAPTGCVGRSFTARVRGTGIARVVFRIDGKRVKVVRKPDRRGLYAVRVNPRGLRVGVHRIVATVVFRRSRGTAPRRLRGAFQRCGNRLIAPRFTG